MSTNLRLNIQDVRPGDRLVISTGLAPAWLGPFVSEVVPHPAVTMLRTVNGGEQVYPSASTVEVVRGLDATGDPGEGY